MMKMNDTGAEVLKLCHFVSTKKRNIAQWSFLHVAIEDKLDEQGYLDEITQYLQHQFKDTDSFLFKHDDTKQAFLITPSKNTESLLQFDRNVYENFPSNVMRASTNSFRDGRISMFADLVAPLLPANDVISDITFKRMRRTSNNIMVLDDDMMILRQVEKIMSSFGSVFTLNNHKNFLEEYKKHAPNILFMDVHLGEVKGPNILAAFYEKIDPNAHVVIISSDQKQETIQNAVQKGIKGYVAKPFNQQQLIEHLMRTETFCARV